MKHFSLASPFRDGLNSDLIRRQKKLCDNRQQRLPRVDPGSKFTSRSFRPLDAYDAVQLADASARR